LIIIIRGLWWGRQKIKKISEIIDFRDTLVFGGLGLIGYGLYLYQPWVSFTVCGSLQMLLGLGWLDRYGGGAKK